MAFVRLGDIVVHHRSEGAATAAPVLLVNSLGTDLRVWDALLAQLGGRIRAIRYDKRGHGLTDLTPGPYAIATLADDLVRLMDHHGLERAVVCGLSIGGMIAQQLAATRPERVSGLVLMDTAHRIGTAQSWQQRLDTVEAEGLEAIADAVLQRWLTPAFHAHRAAELQGWRNMLTRTPATGYAACCAAIRDAELTRAAAGIGVPTLCLVGEVDEVTPPALVAELAALIPGARLEVVAQAGHLPCVEQPRVVALLLQAFLEETGLG